MIYPPTDRINPLPFLNELRGYKKRTLRRDAQAGVTVAIFAIPQMMAYAILAGVPPIHGLYAGMVAALVAALWGGSPFINTGPTNSASLLTAATLAPFMAQGDFMATVALFTLLVGIMRLLMGLLRMGSLIHFVPESAFLGYTVGIGGMIALGQLHHLLGISASSAGSFIGRTIEVLGHAGAANPWSLGVGLATFVAMLTLNRFSKHFPVALLVIAAATLLGVLLPDAGGMRLVQDIAQVPVGLPGFRLPDLDYSKIQPMLAGAAAVAIMGLVEAVSIGQTLALKHQRHLNFNQEFFGQGLSMMVSAFFQGIPGSGSFSRSKLIEECGGITRLSNVFYSLFTAAALLAIPGLLNLIPIPSLAGLLLFIGVKLVDTRRIHRVFKTSRDDATILLVTFLVTLLIRIEYGIFVGIILATLIVMNRSRSLRLAELIPHVDGSFKEHRYKPGSVHEPSDVVALTVYGELFYGLAVDLREQLNEVANLQKPKAIVLRIRRAYSIDYSCWNALFDFAEIFARRGGKLYLAGVRGDVHDIIQQAKMEEVLPPHQVRAFTGVVMESFIQILQELLQELPEDAHLPGYWKDYRENPAVVNERQIRDIARFLNGDA